MGSDLPKGLLYYQTGRSENCGDREVEYLALFLTPFDPKHSRFVRTKCGPQAAFRITSVGAFASLKTPEGENFKHCSQTRGSR